MHLSLPLNSYLVSIQQYGIRMRLWCQLSGHLILLQLDKDLAAKLIRDKHEVEVSDYVLGCHIVMTFDWIMNS